MVIRQLTRWPDYFPRVRRQPVIERRWVGPRRVLTIEEQLEVRNALGRHGFRDGLASRLAARYGVSVRTIYRYARTPTMATTVLRARLREWAREREILLTRDDLETLVEAIAQACQ